MWGRCDWLISPLRHNFSLYDNRADLVSRDPVGLERVLLGVVYTIRANSRLTKFLLRLLQTPKMIQYFKAEPA